MIDFRLTDLRGRTLADPAETAGGSVVVRLNDRRTATTTVSFDEPAAKHVDALSTVLRARLDGQPIFAGTITRPQYDFAARRVALPAVDPVGRLAASFIAGRSDGAGLFGAIGGNPLRWEGLDQGEMVARLIDHAQPTAAEVAAGVPDLGIVRGNLPATIARTREYEAGKQVWEAIAQLSAVRDGVDVELAPVDNGTSTLARLNVYVQQGAFRQNVVVLQSGWGQHNCAPPVIEEAGDVVRNRSIHVGAVVGTTPAPITRRDNVPSELVVGLWGEYLGESDVTDQATLDDHADAVVAAYGFAPFFFTVKPAAQDARSLTGADVGIAPRFAPDGDYWLGDLIRIDARDQPSGLRFDIVGRVLEATLTNLANGTVEVTLVCGPVVGGGYRIRGLRPPGLAGSLANLAERVRLSTLTG